MGVFQETERSLFCTYKATIQFRDRVAGATPKSPQIIEAWLRKRAGIDADAEVMQVMRRTLRELGADITDDMTMEQLEEASKSLAAERSTNGFRRDANGLYLEERCLKAAIKESVNILFAGERWGTTRKGPKSFSAERVFVDPAHLSFGRMEPDKVELFIGHTTGPKGPQSTLTYVEVCYRPTVTLYVSSLRDEISAEQWPMIWVSMQEQGLGALRSQGFGRFDVTAWERVKTFDRATIASPPDEEYETIYQATGLGDQVGSLSREEYARLQPAGIGGNSR